MSRDYGREIDELRADQEALRHEWLAAKTRIRAGADEIRDISGRLHEIADEMQEAVSG